MMAEDAKKATDGESSPAPEKEPRKKKIKDMSLKEIESRLAELKTTQGGLRSRYARHLLDRKNALSS